MSSLPVVLTFGLSDATGAGGVQADQLALREHGLPSGHGDHRDRNDRARRRR